jgi:hypothetical protein
MNQKPCEAIVSSSLFFVVLASLAIHVPLASAQQCGHNSESLRFDSVYSGGQYQSTGHDQNTSKHDAAEFSHGSASGGAPESDSYAGGADRATLGNKPGEGSKIQPSFERLQVSKPVDFNQDIFYKNKLEFSLDGGWLPINIPFPFDFMLGADYNTYPLKYTLVPMVASLRWQIGDLRGPMILRGNWDVEFSGAVIAIPRGPETRYFSYIMGMRRNFVPRNSRVAPYFDWRAGLGNIDAKGPEGVAYAQGQNFTFTLNMGSGVRYNFNPRYAISAGLNWMHISNANLSEGNGKPNWGFRNYGINVVGPMVGIDIQVRRHPRNSVQ